MNHDVFISYSSKEKAVADGVCHYLEDHGVKCWMAPRDIPAGTDYGDLIDEAIKVSNVVVLVYSEAAFLSKWVKGEINVAFDEGKPIAPFRIDETTIKGAFRVMLNQMHWIDAYPSYSDRLPDLLRSVCGILGREVPKQQSPVSVDKEDPAVTTESVKHLLKIRSNLDCRLFIDREECITIKSGSIAKVPLHQGEYLMQATTLDGLDTIEQELDMPAADKLMFFDLLALQKERLALEQQLKEEAERKRREEVERKKRVEAAQKPKEDAERKAREEAERKAKEEAERKAREKAEREDLQRKYGKFIITGDYDGGSTISDGKYRNRLDLKDIEIKSWVDKICSGAFCGCSNLVSITLPETLKVIETRAFQDCIELRTVTIPKSVQEIGPAAFQGCDKLKTVRLLNPNTKYARNKLSLFGNMYRYDFSFPDHTEIIKG